MEGKFVLEQIWQNLDNAESLFFYPPALEIFKEIEITKIRHPEEDISFDEIQWLLLGPYTDGSFGLFVRDYQETENPIMVAQKAKKVLSLLRYEPPDTQKGQIAWRLRWIKDFNSISPWYQSRREKLWVLVIDMAGQLQFLKCNVHNRKVFCQAICDYWGNSLVYSWCSCWDYC